MSQRTKIRENMSAARKPRKRTGLKPGWETAREEAPGTCGTSVLKRSDGGWSGILQYPIDNLRAASPKSLRETRQSRRRLLTGYCRAGEEKEQPPLDVGVQRRGFRAFSVRRGKALILREKVIEVSTMSGYEACLVRKVAST